MPIFSKPKEFTSLEPSNLHFRKESFIKTFLLVCYWTSFNRNTYFFYKKPVYKKLEAGAPQELRNFQH